MGKLTQIYLGMALSLSAFAQSAANFDVKTLAPGEAAPKAGAAAVPSAKEAGPVSMTPSRYIGQSELEAHLASLSAVFLIKSRTSDPFGQLQDPDSKPVIKVAAMKTLHHPAPILATPFADIIRLLVVTTIMPGEKRFLVGTRSVKQGDQLPLTFRGKQIRVQVIDVTSRQIAFRNLDTGETANRKLDMLPVGMTAGNHGITAPGMVQDRPNAPIELETANPHPE